jgi:hypothetical protein
MGVSTILALCGHQAWRVVVDPLHVSYTPGIAAYYFCRMLKLRNLRFLRNVFFPRAANNLEHFFAEF